MTAKPILFNDAMVRAVLSGRKTQTRRPVKHIPALGRPDNWCERAEAPELKGLIGDFRRFCPFGVPGGQLWVRECWGCPEVDHPKCKDGRKPTKGDRVVYRANPADDWQWRGGLGCGDFVWRPSIHMPRWASRITLDVTAVRVEKAQSISEDGAQAEGLNGPMIDPELDRVVNQIGRLPSECFAELWDGIYSKQPGLSWESNPWVWVVEFQLAQEVSP